MLLNVEPDHLDRHGTLEDYRDAKLRIFANQRPEHLAVGPPALLPETLAAQRVEVGRDLVVDVGRLVWRGTPLMETGEVRLRGAHNLANAMAAAAVSLARGLPPEAVAEALRTFAGVPHRLEEVARRDEVVYVNDSKATNVASTLVALAAFAGERVHLILGGQGKAQDFTPLRDATAGCAGVYLIGEDGPAIGAAIGGGRPVRRPRACRGGRPRRRGAR